VDNVPALPPGTKFGDLTLRVIIMVTAVLCLVRLHFAEVSVRGAWSAWAPRCQYEGCRFRPGAVLSQLGELHMAVPDRLLAGMRLCKAPPCLSIRSVHPTYRDNDANGSSSILTRLVFYKIPRWWLLWCDRIDTPLELTGPCIQVPALTWNGVYG